MNLIIVSGATSTGKTTLAKKLSGDLRITAFLRDSFKEKSFDEFGGMPSLLQLAKIEISSYKELVDQIAAAEKSDSNLIIESNFQYKERKKLQRLFKKPINIIEIFCYANSRTILRRYIKRYRSGERHKGHRDYLWYPIVAYESFGAMNRRYKPLNLSVSTMRVDTEDFSKIQYDKIIGYVQDHLLIYNN